MTINFFCELIYSSYRNCGIFQILPVRGCWIYGWLLWRDVLRSNACAMLPGPVGKTSLTWITQVGSHHAYPSRTDGLAGIAPSCTVWSVSAIQHALYDHIGKSLHTRVKISYILLGGVTQWVQTFHCAGQSSATQSGPVAFTTGPRSLSPRGPPSKGRQSTSGKWRTGT